jgi:3-hydroxyacyl-CoA dehydrogenase/enoyl-CoA hydratase/carnithine racemase
MQTEFKLRRWNRIAILTVDNGEDHTKPTTLNLAAWDSLGRALDELEAEEWDGLLLTGKPFVFCAGADISMFEAARGPEDALRITRRGHEELLRLRALPFPTVAAINGACIGGGVELALHADARTIAASVRHFASPECFLGIVPGWGGTQLIPRLVGARAAVQFVVANAMERNRMIDAKQAFELGFADRLLEPVEFVDESLAYLQELIAAGGMQRADADLSDVAEVCRKARANLDASIHGAAPAPYKALDLIEGAAGWSLEEGYRQEEQASAELGLTRQAQASIYAFGLTQFRAKRPLGLDAQPRTIRKVGVVGAGLMATQIATLLLKRLEVPIAMRDLSREVVDRAVTEVGSGQKGSRAAFLASLVTGTTGWDGFADCDLVIEAVFESLPVKHELFAKLDRICPEQTIFASNTSTISITEIAGGSGRADRFVGMHFCLPAQLMKLIEMSPGLNTSEETFARAWAVAEAMGQKPVKTQDTPGFVLNYFLIPFNNDAIRLVEQGVAEPADIDLAIKTAMGYAMGPMELLDLVGMDTQKLLCEAMHGITHEPRAACPPLVKKMIAAGWLGKKSGRGFHTYQDSKMFGA